MMVEDWQAIGLSLQLAFISTLLLMLICLPLAWWLARSDSRWLPLWNSLIALPIVLPPSVLGFYLLLSFHPESWLSQGLGTSLAFTFEGLVIGSMLYSLPFVVQPLRTAFMGIEQASLELASSLGAGPIDRFFSVAIPLAKPGILTAAILGFAHTLGEFGVVLMIGGNIPGETRVASMVVYEHVETLEYQAAHHVSAALLLIAFSLLLIVYFLESKRDQRRIQSTRKVH